MYSTVHERISHLSSCGFLGADVFPEVAGDESLPCVAQRVYLSKVAPSDVADEGSASIVHNRYNCCHTALYGSPCNEERIHRRSLLCSRHRRLCSIRSHLRVPYRLWVIESLNLPIALPTYSPYCLTGLQQRGRGNSIDAVLPGGHLLSKFNTICFV